MENTSVFTGQKQPILPKLQHCIEKARKIHFVVSFIRDSGAKLIAKSLEKAVKEGKEVKVITSDYLNVTEPNALYRLSDVVKDIKIFDNNKNNLISFHPKTYIFEYEGGEGEVLIGSSNLSYSALLKGVEWNFAFKKSQNQNEFQKFLDEFNDLYENNSFDMSIEWLRKYEKSYRKNPDIIDTVPEEKEVSPIKFQVPALYELSKTREEGYARAMVIVATGLGKTYLSAFDTLNYNKILFVAHREEILKQAMNTFKTVHRDKTVGLFNAYSKCIDNDITFASIQTLGKKEYLNNKYFSKDYFDYIIVDEFHHAGASSYEKLMEYFEPDFLLGLTATPDRMDNKDIYKWCHYNIAYECNFKTGINNGWLVPFDYYGIYDEVDYEAIPWRSGKYDVEELENKLMVKERVTQIINKFKIYGKKKTVAFCASVKHAEYMADAFNKAKIKSETITSNTTSRSNVMDRFQNGDLQVIFTVDIFNEGVDIPGIDTVLFLRPTNSYTIFIQQLGRGLRTSPGKEKLTVIDMVGNYKGAELKPLFLSGEYNPKNAKQILSLPAELKLPAGCNMNFDLRIVDYLAKTIHTRINLKERLKREYLDIRKSFGRVPTLTEVFESSNYGLSTYIREFKGWLNFLDVMDDLSVEQSEYINTPAGEFLYELEKTAMTKSYKIPAILSLLTGVEIKKEASADIIGKGFKEFYSDELHGRDLNNKRHKNWKEWQLSDFEKLALDNPVKFLSKGKFFEYDKASKLFSIADPYHSELMKYKLAEDIKERLNYRNINYFNRKYGEV